MRGAIATRPAEASDAEAVAGLFRRSRALLAFLPELHSAAEDLQFVRDRLIARQRVTLAEYEGSLAGFVAETPGWIEHLYLEPDRRGMGIGSALLGEVMARQKTISLWVFAENWPARRFYERHGFVPVECTDGAANEARLPDIRYERA